MKTVLLGVGTFLAADLEGFAAPPAWRKATRNMIMAAASIERALRGIPLWDARGRDASGIVLGSSAGELETSADFLTTWSKQKLARPLLFQNSLHNATTGFASIHFKITGPSFSISSGDLTPRDCVELAQTLIADGSCRACIVTLVEAHKVLAGFIGESVDEGAASIVIADSEWAHEMGFSSLGEFDPSQWSGSYAREARTAPLFSVMNAPFFKQAQAWSARA